MWSKSICQKNHPKNLVRKMFWLKKVGKTVLQKKTKLKGPYHPIKFFDMWRISPPWKTIRLETIKCKLNVGVYCSGFMSNSYHQGKVLSVICDKKNHRPNVQAQCDKKNIGSMFRLNVQVICDKEKIGSMCTLSVQA